MRKTGAMIAILAGVALVPLGTAGSEDRDDARDEAACARGSTPIS